MDPLPPIPIPLSERVRDVRQRFIPGITYGLVLLAAIITWRNYVSPPTLIGQVEAVHANLASAKPGALVQLNLQLFQEVKAGEIVAQVVITDPKVLSASLAVIQAEIDLLRVNLAPVMTQQRYSLSSDRLELDWLKERVDLATAKVKLQEADTEYRRNGELFKEKLISELVYDQSRARKDALQSEVEERTHLVAEQEVKVKESRLLPDLRPSGSETNSFKNDAMRAAIAVQAEKIRLTEAELSPIPLKVPLSGKVTTIFKRAGENVMAGEPIVAISATHSDHIVGYVLQPLTIQPKKGMSVRVRTRTPQRLTGTGKILEIGAQMQAVSQPLLRPGVTFETGIPILVSLPSNVQAVPGELLELTLINN